MKLYEVTAHAVERAVERLGRKREHAANELIQRMQTAVYVGTSGHGRIFDHYRTRSRIVVDKTRDIVVTVYSMDTDEEGNPVIRTPLVPIHSSSNVILAAAHATIKRELAKARRSFTAELRKLKIEQAELGVEIAQAIANKARCKAPHTQTIIQQRIDAMQTYHDVVGAKIAEETAEYSRVKTEAQAFIGEGVSL